MFPTGPRYPSSSPSKSTRAISNSPLRSRAPSPPHAAEVLRECTQCCSIIGPVLLCRGEGQHPTNYGRWYQRCNTCGFMRWHTDRTPADQLPPHLQIRQALQNSVADVESPTLVSPAPYTGSQFSFPSSSTTTMPSPTPTFPPSQSMSNTAPPVTSGQVLCSACSGNNKTTRANKECGRKPVLCAACCRTAGGCSKHPAIRSSSAAVPSTQYPSILRSDGADFPGGQARSTSQPAPQTTAALSTLRSEYSRPLEPLYGEWKKKEDQRTARIQAMESEKAGSLELARVITLVFWHTAAPSFPARLKISTLVAGLFRPSDHADILKPYNGPLTPIIEIFDIPARQWTGQAPTTPVQVPSCGRVLLRCVGLPDTECVKLDMELDKILLRKGVKQTLLPAEHIVEGWSSSTGTESDTIKFEASASCRTATLVAATCPETPASATSSHLRSRSPSVTLLDTPIPTRRSESATPLATKTHQPGFPLFYYADMAKGMREMESWKKGRGQRQEQALRLAFGIPVARNRYYEMKAVWQSAPPTITGDFDGKSRGSDTTWKAFRTALRAGIALKRDESPDIVELPAPAASQQSQHPSGGKRQARKSILNSLQNMSPEDREIEGVDVFSGVFTQPGTIDVLCGNVHPFSGARKIFVEMSTDADGLFLGKKYTDTVLASPHSFDIFSDATHLSLIMRTIEYFDEWAQRTSLVYPVFAFTETWMLQMVDEPANAGWICQKIIRPPFSVMNCTAYETLSQQLEHPYLQLLNMLSHLVYHRTEHQLVTVQYQALLKDDRLFIIDMTTHDCNPYKRGVPGNGGELAVSVWASKHACNMYCTMQSLPSLD